MASVPLEQQHTSSITLGELIYGAYRFPDRTAELLLRFEEVLRHGLPILPFDAEAARRYGEIRAELERSGRPIGDADLRIASIALARGLTVVTGNLRHFRIIPNLTVENWLE
jgi:tRNA(fMet)-specific endonuclease VapC